MKKTTKKCLSIFSVLLCANLALTTAGFPRKALASMAETTSFVPTISATPYCGEEVNLLAGDILEYASDYQLGKSARYLSIGFGPGNDYREEDFAPVSMWLSWQSEEGVQYYTVKVSTKADLSDSVGYITLSTTLDLTDLFAGTDYYYQIIAHYADKTVKSQIFTFRTANLIRTIEMEGVSNTRDIGGYYTIDGTKRIRQGIVYRGARLETITAAGVYSLTLRAADYYGNESTKVITVTVLEPDLEAPVIHFSLTKIYAQVGMIPQLNVEVTDNRKVAHVAYAWSEGALDEKGALTEGTHTYTVTAKDDSNNETVHTITVYVTKDEPEYDNVIDEEELSPRLTVTFYGENSATYKYGEKVKKPADPVREDTEEYAYTFEGWYNGDIAWDFDKDIVVTDMNLVAKWTETSLLPGDTENPEQSSTDSETPEQSSLENENSEQSSNQSTPISSVNNSNAGKKRDCSGAMQFSLFLPVLLCACIAYRKKDNKNE